MTKRYLYLDILRIIACFLVIVNHTNSSIFLSLAPCPVWFASLTYFFISKTAVPVFIMISGALLLPKEESYAATWLRLLRIVLVTAAFSLLYYTKSIIAANQSFHVSAWLKTIFSGNITNSYWYLYLYISILIMLPLFRRMNSAMQTKDYLYMALFALSPAPILVHYFPLLGQHISLNLFIFNSYACMLFLGCYISRRSEITRTAAVISAVVFVLSIAFEVFMTYCEYYSAGDGGDYLFFDNNTFPTVMISAVCLFISVRYLARSAGVSPRLSAFCGEVGRCTFGIYLFSDFFISVFSPIRACLEACMPLLPAVVLFELLVFFAGGIITWLLRRIPFVGKFI